MTTHRAFGTLLFVLSIAVCSACNRTATNAPITATGANSLEGRQTEAKQSFPRFDGLYCSKEWQKLKMELEKNDAGKVPNYFRFFADGAFVHTAAVTEPREVATWITAKMPGLLADEGDGVYRIEGNRLSLTFPKQRAHDPSRPQWLEWSRKIEGDEIDLEWHENTKDPPKRELLHKERLIFVPVQFGHNR